MRQSAKIDDNQKYIVTSLRRCGYSVLILSGVGHGCPDICVGKDDINYFFEIKDGNKSASKTKLTADEDKFFQTWRGQVDKVCSLEEILTIIHKHSGDSRELKNSKHWEGL